MGLIRYYSTPKTNSGMDGISSAGFDESSTSFECQRLNPENEHHNSQLVRSPATSTQSSEKHLFDNELAHSSISSHSCQSSDWSWDSNNIQAQTIVDNCTVQFHPSYSQGTSVVRSDRQLKPNMIHYWEIEIVHWFSGTDLMVGIGTDDVDVQEYRYKFASALGLSESSWGFSHRGMIQHKNVLRYYGKSFTKKSIVGVYLDLSCGQLEFYVNRKPQGTAYRNIPLDKNLYAMVCSTSAKSAVRLINAISLHDSLQFRCMKVIAKYSNLLKEVQHVPGLSHLCRSVWFLFPRERYEYTNRSTSEGNEKTPNSVPKISDEHDDIHNVYANGECETSNKNSNDAIDEAIFHTPVQDLSETTSNSVSDDEPCYCDAD